MDLRELTGGPHVAAAIWPCIYLFRSILRVNRRNSDQNVKIRIRCKDVPVPRIIQAKRRSAFYSALQTKRRTARRPLRHAAGVNSRL